MKRKDTPSATPRKSSRKKSTTEATAPPPSNVVAMPAGVSRPRPVKLVAVRKDAQTVLSQDAIARRAYELFEARNGEHGHDMEDWLQAERELAAPAKPARRKPVSA